MKSLINGRQIAYALGCQEVYPQQPWIEKRLRCFRNWALAEKEIIRIGLFNSTTERGRIEPRILEAPEPTPISVRGIL